jgi:hypothetical protein
MRLGTALHAAYDREMAAVQAAFAARKPDAAFAHLERAHILGQRNTRAHTLAHAGMLAIGWRRRDPREVLGQCLRIAAALTKSVIWVPVGNTGGTNVNPFKRMPVPEDLRTYLD